MGFRRYTDRDGNRWEVRPRSRAEWHFEPLPGNPGPRRVARAPGYEQDPFELSEQELERVFERARGGGPTRDPSSLFKD